LEPAILSAPASSSTLAWNPNSAETQKHFPAWWQRTGLVVGSWDAPRASAPIEAVRDPGPPADRRAMYCDLAQRAAGMHHGLANGWYGLDILPVAVTEFGPGSLGTFLGCEPHFDHSSVWYDHPWSEVANPESLPPLRLDPEAPWWKTHLACIDAMLPLAKDRYLVSCPDLIEGIDTLASLRSNGRLLEDLVDRPEWVEERLAELNQVWFAAYQAIYERIRLADGSSCFWAYLLWGDGKTAKVQCDASAMFSPRMFKRFVVPQLTEQCRWLDHSCYHLDGSQALCHLDLLLGLPELDAIEWTPDPKVPEAGNPCWHELYRRIKAAGKSVLAHQIRAEEVQPLIDAVGPEGLYVQCLFRDQAEAERVGRMVERYR